jgi:hypothetical protein
MLTTLAPCMDCYDVGEADAEWPNNILSTLTVVHSTGQIARRGEPARPVAQDELALCRTLSREAAAIMKKVPVGMGSEAGDGFRPFFVTAAAEAPRPRRIDGKVIRRAFGGTIFPPATISVEPLQERGVWWSEVLQDGEGQKESYFAPWRALIACFGRQEAFVHSAFVRIGDSMALTELPEDQYPEGTDMPGCVLPRLALGLTQGGSLAGLFGYVVQT